MVKVEPGAQQHLSLKTVERRSSQWRGEEDSPWPHLLYMADRLNNYNKMSFWLCLFWNETKLSRWGLIHAKYRDNYFTWSGSFHLIRLYWHFIYYNHSDSSEFELYFNPKGSFLRSCVREIFFTSWTFPTKISTTNPGLYSSIHSTSGYWGTHSPICHLAKRYDNLFSLLFLFV